MRPLYFLSLLLFTVTAAAAGQAKSPMAFFPGTELEWKDGPPSLPKGAKMAILEGDPTQPEMFTVILVVGATGLLGGEICRVLTQRGTPVRALVRGTSNPDRVAHLKSVGAEQVRGDLKDRPSLDAACRGASAVISTASSTVS